MICELFPFQKQAVNEMRLRVAMALNNYRMLKIPQVVSLQAPTGSGKTIIMSALIEDIFYGSEQFTEQPEAIFVWLSDSPQLNEQSKQKIELKADKVRMDQCVVISDESFDREILEDGHIYFLNTQKLGKAGNLSRHSDTRQYTIWETIENTAREKADRLYFIIDEAHRGMQGRQAGTATTIMQRFIKGSSEQNLSPIPVVIGMSATAERFNSLVGQATNSTLHKVVISPAQVRQSGLLKDRIVITYPEDPIKHGDMAVLQAATDEWQDKCKHWYQYTYEQHYTNVNPVFVIQVCAGSGTKVSDTDLDDVIAKIEERMGDSFKENEVVHTFGSTGTLSIHGLTVPHIESSEIAEDRRIRVVLFKENLSTGWDCPRAETMMSFRRAEDATYIAQLLGRMVRTPLGFTRVDAPDPDADEQTNIVYLNKGKTEKWLPAAEVHGEGVFIEFNRDSIDAWLRDPELGALSQKYAQCYKEFCESKEWTVTTLRDARYVLMHTFAHLLIKQMSMSSGYSSSAIRERIYFGDDMSGVLLYTGSADKEGSLGGLVELGNIDQLIVLMKDAFQEALVCTNDPECLNNVPAGNNSNGAACHSCCMISETACENGNRMLDRGLIVPIDGRENQSYFKTLVEELCQLEV